MPSPSFSSASASPSTHSTPSSPSATLRILGLPCPSLLSSLITIFTPSTSSDYLALGNHFFLLASIGYFTAHLLDSFLSDDGGLNDLSIELFFMVLAIIFVVDAWLYWKYSIKGIGWSTRRNVPPSVSSSSPSPSPILSLSEVPHRSDDANDVGELRGNSLSSHSSTSSDSPFVDGDFSDAIVVGEHIEMIANPTNQMDDIDLTVQAAAFHHHYQVNVFPLSAASMAEVFNVKGSLLTLCASLTPLFGRVLYGSSSIWNIPSLWFDFFSMAVYVVSALCYYWTWYRVSGSTKYIQPTSVGFWAEFFNISACAIYLLAQAAELGIAYEWIGEDKPGRDATLRKAEIAAFVGDIWYIVAAIFYELSYYRDVGKAEKFQHSLRKRRKGPTETKSEMNGNGHVGRKWKGIRNGNDGSSDRILNGGWSKKENKRARNGNAKGDPYVIDSEASVVSVFAETEEDEGELFKNDIDEVNHPG